MRTMILTLTFLSLACCADEVQDMLAIQVQRVAVQRSEVLSLSKSLERSRIAMTMAHGEDIEVARKGSIGIEKALAKEQETLAKMQLVEAAIRTRIQSQAKAPIKEAAPLQKQIVSVTTPLFLLTLNDGSVIKCLRYMEVDEAYSLQMPNKAFKTIPKDSVKSIAREVAEKVTD